MSIGLNSHGEPLAVLLVASAVTRSIVTATRLGFPLPSLASFAGTCKAWKVYELQSRVLYPGMMNHLRLACCSLILFSLNFYDREKRFVIYCKIAARSDNFVSFETAMICKLV